MTVMFTIARYPKYLGFAGLLSMAVFRLPLWMNRNISFWKLMGCGKNGTFDIHPDWRQWAILVIRDEELATGYELQAASRKLQPKNEKYQIPNIHGSFISAWLKLFRCQILTYVLDPIEGHGTWDGKEVFGHLPKQTDYSGSIAVLTRATIRISRLKHFWRHVSPVAAQMRAAPGFISSIGIGEVPWIKQATFSIWQSREHMKQFAYGMQQHTAVIKKTRQEKWYSEDMFVRFKVIESSGSLNGHNPLQSFL